MNENIVKIGSVFCMSWGYDQTNVDYFQVVRLTPKGAVLREIASKKVPGTDGFMCCDVRPDVGNFVSNSTWSKKPEGFQVRLNGSTRFLLNGRYLADLMFDTNEKHYCSWYA